MLLPLLPPRHLYLSELQACYLFKGCQQKFLDAVLAAAHVELFMPKASAQAGHSTYNTWRTWGGGSGSYHPALL